MSEQSFAFTLKLMLVVGSAVFAAACQASAAPAPMVPARLTPHIDWSRLEAVPPTLRKVQAFSRPAAFSTGMVARTEGALGIGTLAGGLLPFYAAGGPGGGPGVYVADSLAHTVHQLPAFGPDVAPLAVSRGGGLIGVNTAGSLGILDPVTQLIQVFPQLASLGITSADVDAYGDIAHTDLDGRVHLFNPLTQQDFIVPIATAGLTGATDVTISGDGRVLTYTGFGVAGPDIYTMDLATGQQLSSGFLNGVNYGGPVQAMQLSADGSQLLFSQLGQLRMLDYRTGLIDNLALLNNGIPITDASFASVDSSRIVFTRAGQIQVFDRVAGLIDTLPYVNRINGLGLFGAGF